MMNRKHYTPPPGMAAVMHLTSGRMFYTPRQAAADCLIAVVIRESGLQASPALIEGLRAEIVSGQKTLELRGYATLKD